MSTVSFTINGREYSLACDNGEEPRLLSLAQELEHRYQEFEATLTGPGRAPVPEHYLWMLNAITLMDELCDARDELKKLHALRVHTSHAFESGKKMEMNQAMAETLDDIAQRLERLAAMA
jgi:cell division protein ZapA